MGLNINDVLTRQIKAIIIHSLTGELQASSIRYKPVGSTTRYEGFSSSSLFLLLFLLNQSCQPDVKIMTRPRHSPVSIPKIQGVYQHRTDTDGRNNNAIDKRGVKSTIFPLFSINKTQGVNQYRTDTDKAGTMPLPNRVSCLSLSYSVVTLELVVGGKYSLLYYRERALPMKINS